MLDDDKSEERRRKKREEEDRKDAQRQEKEKIERDRRNRQGASAKHKKGATFQLLPSAGTATISGNSARLRNAPQLLCMSKVSVRLLFKMNNHGVSVTSRVKGP